MIYISNEKMRKLNKAYEAAGLKEEQARKKVEGPLDPVYSDMQKVSQKIWWDNKKAMRENN